ncbi:MAG: hypothetical protein HKN50_05400 [Gammaproteobacteria bacterium]|nr:hypothetical protein [Gammaproteobacteria bacterium]
MILSKKDLKTIRAIPRGDVFLAALIKRFGPQEVADNLTNDVTDKLTDNAAKPADADRLRCTPPKP